MTAHFSLHAIDWIIIAGYLLLALGVGLKVKGLAEADRESYFLAGRSLPWWWAGLSIAATTFAADTPLAVTGIIASKGLSGNWMWLSWIAVHAAVVVYFAARWSKSGVLTDAEIVQRRYSGRPAETLRWFRALLYGVVYNAIVLGWVLAAMVKIVTPFFHWNEWLPGIMGWFGTFWPEGSPLGTPSEGLTIVALLLIVGIYSSLGGIRGVILTDLLQLGLALVGSFWLAAAAWARVGGRDQMIAALDRIYGTEQTYADLLPSLSSGWLGALGIGAFAFGAYLMVQSYANVPADGGGYLMQRLNTTPNAQAATRASLLFLGLQYLVRTWPWFIVGISALILIPLGHEQTALGGRAGIVAGDRELAYPVLMAELLPPAALGMMVASLLAAFMSTIDTHINWGASYMVNDVYLRLRPDASPQQQVRIGRVAVLGFVLLAIVVSLQIRTIEQAWQWVAALGAALGVPTALRWLWWRVNATGELCAAVVGLATAVVLNTFTDLAYEIRLVLISSASVLGLAMGMIWGAPTNPKRVTAFVESVRPLGFWPGVSVRQSIGESATVAARWFGLVGGAVALLFAMHRLIFVPRGEVTALALILFGAAALFSATARRSA